MGRLRRVRAPFRGLVGRHHGLGDLAVHVLVSAGGGCGQHHGLGIVGFAQRAQHVEILVEQHHVVHVADVHADGLQTLDLVDDAAGDLTTVVGLAFALQTGLLGFRGCLGLDLDALGLGALAGGLLLTLGGVDGIHGVLDLRAWIDGGNQGLDHGEAETGHLIADGLLHIEGHIVLAGEGIIKAQRRNGGTQRVLHVGTQLTGRIAQLIVGGGHVFRVHTELGGGHDGDEHVVKRLGLQLHIELVDAHVGLHGDAVHERNADVDARELDLVELAESFDDVGLLLRHDEQRGQEQERDDQRNDKERYKERHDITPFFGFSLKVLSHDLS